eukprot:2505965-Pleurochrysis_carterae.AAC.1
MYTRASEERRGSFGGMRRKVRMMHVRTRRAMRQRRFVGYVSEHTASCCALACAVAANIRSAATMLSTEVRAVS